MPATTDPALPRVDARAEDGDHRPVRGEQLSGVQILRAVAALMVLVHHVAEESHALFAPGAYPARAVLVGVSSVDLFFVISGFIMLHTTWAQIGEEGAVRTFVWRRLSRIFPLYWSCLLMFAAAKALGFYQRVEPSPYTMLASFALLPSHGLFISPAWTLVFEMYFYALFAAWMCAGSPRALALGLPLTSVAVVALAGLLPPSDLRDYLENPLALDFLYGLGLAVLLRRGVRPRSPWPFALLGAVLILASAALGPTTGANAADLPRSLRFLLFGLPAAMVVYGSLAVGRAASPLGRALGTLGDASYALYLTHGFVMTAYARLLQRPTIAHALPLAAWMLLVTAFAIALGIATHVLIERPLSRAVRAVGRGPKRALAPRPASAGK